MKVRVPETVPVLGAESGRVVAGLFDPFCQMFRRTVRPGDADNVVARRGESLGDISAEPFRHAG